MHVQYTKCTDLSLEYGPIKPTTPSPMTLNKSAIIVNDADLRLAVGDQSADENRMPRLAQVGESVSQLVSQ